MVRVGLIGCGGMGMNLARHCHSLEDSKITAVHDRDEKALTRAAAEFGAQAYSSYKKLIASDVDAVIVATPNDSHAPITIAAANAGKHVFCEKPMALRVSDCRAMIDAAEKAGVKLMVGHVLRLIPVFWKTKQIIDSGILGKPFAIAVTRLGGPDSLAAGWRAAKKHAGGYLYEINVHELDYMRFVMGEPETVFASTGHFTASPVEFEDVAFVHIKYAGGGIGTLHCGGSSSIKKYEMMIQCTEGTIANGGFGGPIRYARFGEEPTVIQVSEITKEDPYREEIRCWVDAITKNTPLPFDGYDGMAAVQTAAAAYRSARLGRAVRYRR
ncbi:MAG: Gfo/Idh/MocA family oxidoreductase [Armatimonadota bacterium]|nr:Gfo/Idh/MocA family oxidoreductase [Armatimonadota bacterium]